MRDVLVWLQMGGYAGYVWSAYGAVLFVFAWHLVQIKAQKKRVWQLLRRGMKRS